VALKVMEAKGSTSGLLQGGALDLFTHTHRETHRIKTLGHGLQVNGIWCVDTDM
jgi:hypothetical protein